MLWGGHCSAALTSRNTSQNDESRPRTLGRTARTGYRNFRRPLQLVARRSVDVVRRSQCRWAPSNPNIIYLAKKQELMAFFSILRFRSSLKPRKLISLRDSRRHTSRIRGVEGPRPSSPGASRESRAFPLEKAQDSRGF